MELRPLGRTKMLIEWEFAPTNASFQEYTITLERSSTPEENYIQLVTVTPSINSYTDDGIRIYRFWKDVYARMHIVKNDGSEEYYTPYVRISPRLYCTRIYS